MAGRVPIKIYRGYTISIYRRTILPPSGPLMSAEPKESFVRLFTTRADVSSHGGLAEVAQVSINGKAVTHTFSIRYTTIAFDTQCVVRDAKGHQWRILKVEDKDLANRELRIYCADMGDSTVEAAL